MSLVYDQDAAFLDDSTRRRARKLLHDSGFSGSQEPAISNASFAASQRNLRQFTHPAANFVTGRNDSAPRPPVRRQPRRNSIGTTGDYDRRRDRDFPVDVTSEHMRQLGVHYVPPEYDHGEMSYPPPHQYPPPGYAGGYVPADGESYHNRGGDLHLPRHNDAPPTEVSSDSSRRSNGEKKPRNPQEASPGKHSRRPPEHPGLPRGQPHPHDPRAEGYPPYQGYSTPWNHGYPPPYPQGSGERHPPPDYPHGMPPQSHYPPHRGAPPGPHHGAPAPAGSWGGYYPPPQQGYPHMQVPMSPSSRGEQMPRQGPSAEASFLSNYMQQYPSHDPRSLYWDCHDDPTDGQDRYGSDDLRGLSGSSAFVDDDKPHAEQIRDLSEGDRRCYFSLKKRWEESYPVFDYPDEMYLRFARQTVEKTGEFNEELAWNKMKSFNKRYLKLSARKLETQLLTKTLFPVPGLKTKLGHNVCYMKPARFFPKKNRTKTIIDNLAYVMNCMLEKQSASRDGIGFIACMDDWGMKNFDVKYWYKLMMALQGETVPVRVQLFLIVNPPSWFGAVLRVMKPMLAPEFRKKVKMIKEEKLSTYLQSGFKELLPDDMESGRASTDAIVNDFIKGRKLIERDRLSSRRNNGAEEEEDDNDDEAEKEDEQNGKVNHDLTSLARLGHFYLDENNHSGSGYSGGSGGMDITESGKDPLGLNQDILSFLSQNDAIAESARPYDYELNYTK